MQNFRNSISFGLNHQNVSHVIYFPYYLICILEVIKNDKWCLKEARYNLCSAYLIYWANFIQSSYNFAGFINMSKRNLKWVGQSYLRTFIFWDTLILSINWQSAVRTVRMLHRNRVFENNLEQQFTHLSPLQ